MFNAINTFATLLDPPNLPVDVYFNFDVFLFDLVFVINEMFEESILVLFSEFE